MNTDVLIVGAGPTGLMLANQLARRGVRAQLIDRHDGPARETRALGVQARTLEIYQHLGFVEEALALGTRAERADMWSRGKLRARVPLSDIGRAMTPYPYLLILGQDDNERLLGDALRKLGRDVAWKTELVGLVQESDHVKATLKTPDSASRVVAARWVAGCDGAKSSVREMNSIAFVGAPYDHVFFVADVRASGPMVAGEMNVYLFPRGFHLFFPMRGADHWRVVGILPPHLRDKEGVTMDDVVPLIREQAVAGVRFQETMWFSTYRIHHRRAERFRAGRCFVLGDAAHIHSPVGAQGMNTGLQDAYNLAWKLALVLSGGANDALLDTFGGERLPVARSLLSTTDAMFSFIVSDKAWAGFFRTRFMPQMLSLAMRVQKLRKLFFRTVSQIGIRYPESRLSQTLPGLPGSAPRAGDRFPWLRVKFSEKGPVEDLFDKLDDMRFNLIVIGQPAPAGELSGPGGPVRRFAIPGGADNDRELDAAGIPRPSFYLLRPDCYVGLCGTRFDPAAAARYFADRY